APPMVVEPQACGAFFEFVQLVGRVHQACAIAIDAAAAFHRALHFLTYFGDSLGTIPIDVLLLDSAFLVDCEREQLALIILVRTISYVLNCGFSGPGTEYQKFAERIGPKTIRAVDADTGSFTCCIEAL